ncbi:MAG: NUDIX hydrolase [Candidatus Nanoarchaeia archaeon]
MKEMIPIVDEEDIVLYYKDRKEVVKEEIYRVSGLTIENSKGQVLLAKRSMSKSHDPGTWGPAVAGTVERGETYESNIIKEAKEELSLDLNISDLKKLYKARRKGNHNFFVQHFFTIIDKPAEEFLFNEEEVSVVAWFDKEELKQKIKNNPEQFVPSMRK